MESKYKNCINACQQCLVDCQYCLVQMAGKESMNDCPSCCIQCIDAGSICIKFMVADSLFVKDYLRLCAQICEWCAEQCQAHNHEHCKLCATSCMACADECRKHLA